jgi:hypothetical protein
MTLLYSLYVESITTQIPKDIAIKICHDVQKYYQENLSISWKFRCHLCDGKGFNDGKNNRGCSLINNIYDNIIKNKF